MMNKERGSVAINVILIILLVVIGVLVYVMARNGRDGGVRGIGVTSPVVVTDAPRAEGAPANARRFSDGLGTASQSTRYTLNEFGEGVESIDVFIRDLNGDAMPDRIIRTRVENGTAHFYHEYKIELGDANGYTDITPDDLRTVRGAECALQQIQFVFKPDFQIIKISRPWRDSWTTPTLAVKTVYGLSNGALRQIQRVPLKLVCDVSDLF